jgi:transcriptional regulator with XRE-family HTH domain
MTESAQLIATIKRLLKAQRLTYRQVAQALQLSEPSVKRLFATERLTVERLAQISALLGLTMAELLQDAAATAPQVRTLSRAQEASMVSNTQLLLVAVCAFNHWSLDDMQRAYRLTRAQGLKQLLVLARMGVIDLLPGDRIRLRVARDFDWLPNGPIRQFFMGQGLADFLGSSFGEPAQLLEFAHGMLTPAAQLEFRAELRRVRAKLAALHAESATAPLAERKGTGVLLAMREWEPLAFVKLRRPPTQQA